MNYLEEMLAHMNVEHHDIIMQLKQTHASLVFPKLFVQMFQLEEEELIEEATAVAMASSSSTTASYAEYMETQPPTHLIPHMLQQQQQQQFQSPEPPAPLSHLEPHQPHQG